jgi:hypothetical protein
MRTKRQDLFRVREQLGLSALDLANSAHCEVETVVRMEMGLSIPTEESERSRLAASYGLGGRAFLRLALDAAERRERRA